MTLNIPKPMLPLVNRPILEHIVKHLKDNGFDSTVFLLYFHPDVIKNYFGDGSDFGIKIDYIVPDSDLGTAGAVKYAEDFIDEDDFLVISGDLLTDIDLRKFYEFHKEKNAKATIALTRVKDPLQFGIVITDRDGRVTKFLEKPTWGEVFSDTVNTGIYLLKKEILSLVPEDAEFDFSKNLFPMLLGEKNALFGYIADGYWRDIGDPDSYREAHYDILEGKVQISVPGEKLDLVGRDVRVGKDVSIARRVILRGTVIFGNNTKVMEGAEISDSVIGNNCVVESGAKIERAIIWDNVYIKAGAVIKGAVVGNGVIIGEEAIIDEGVVVGDECSVGKHAVLKKGVKIWPHKVIEEEAVVSSNLVWGERWRKSLFEGARITGLTNVELTPEVCAKLGAAYGTVLPKGSYVLLGRDSHPSSRMLRRAFIGGLVSTGVNVRDTQMLPIPVFRYKLESFGEVGGVYFRQAPDDPPSTEIHFFDADGIDITTSFGKNVERIFFREDFRRAHYNEPGEISLVPRVVDFYKEGFFQTLNADLIRGKKFKVVIDFSHGSPSVVLPSLLDNLKCEVVGLNAYLDYTRLAKKEEEIERSLSQLAAIVKSLKYDLGFYLFPSGERFIAVDEKGNIYRDVHLLVVLADLLMRVSEKKGIISVPAFAPSFLTDIAQKRGFTLRRISTSPRAMAEEAQKPEVLLVASGEGEFIFPEFQYAPDALFAIVKILELLAKLDRPMSYIGKEVPRYHLQYSRISCPLYKKGATMRRMSEEARGREISFLDGIKFQEGSGWVMIRPDQFKPFIHLYAEAATEEEAEELIRRYEEKLRKWIEG